MSVIGQSESVSRSERRRRSAGRYGVASSVRRVAPAVRRVRRRPEGLSADVLEVAAAVQLVDPSSLPVVERVRLVRVLRRLQSSAALALGRLE